MLLISWLVRDIYLGVVVVISLLPIAVLYGELTIREFNALENKYDGWKFFIWPLFIFLAGMGARIIFNTL
jgi:hypothetical protein